METAAKWAWRANQRRASSLKSAVRMVFTSAVRALKVREKISHSLNVSVYANKLLPKDNHVVKDCEAGTSGILCTILHMYSIYAFMSR